MKTIQERLRDAVREEVLANDTGTVVVALLELAGELGRELAQANLGDVRETMLNILSEEMNIHDQIDPSRPANLP